MARPNINRSNSDLLRMEPIWGRQPASPGAPSIGLSRNASIPRQMSSLAAAATSEGSSVDGIEHDQLKHRYEKVERDRANLLLLVLGMLASSGKLRLPANLTIDNVELSRVDVSYVLECMQMKKDVIIPQAWTNSGWDQSSLSVDVTAGQGGSNRVSRTSSGTGASHLRKTSLPSANAAPISEDPAVEDPRWSIAPSLNVPLSNIAPVLIPIPSLSPMSESQTQFPPGDTPVVEDSSVYVYEPYFNYAAYAVKLANSADWRYQEHFEQPCGGHELELCAYSALLYACSISTEKSNLLNICKQQFRPFLEISARKHQGFLDLLNGAQMGSNGTRFEHIIFPLSFLRQSSSSLPFDSPNEEASWRNRQLHFLLSCLRFYLWAIPETWPKLNETVRQYLQPDSGYPEPLLNQIQDLVLEMLSSDCLIEDLQQQGTVYHDFHQTLYERILQCCMDSEVPWVIGSSTSSGMLMELLRQYCRVFRLHSATHDFALARVSYRAYVRTGNSAALPQVQGALLRARETGKLDAVKSTFFLYLSTSLKQTLCNFQDWPPQRTGDFEGICRLLVLSHPELADYKTLISPVDADGIFATLFEHPSARRELSQAMSASKRLQCTSRILPSLQGAVSMDRVSDYLGICFTQLDVDRNRWWPAMKKCIISSDWWDAIVVVSLECLTRDILHPLGQQRFEMSQSVIEVMKHLVEFDGLIREMNKEIAPESKYEFDYQSIFDNPVRVWVRAQLEFMMGVADRSFFGETWKEPADPSVLHTDSILTVFNCMNSVVKMLFSLPVRELVEKYILHVIYDFHTVICQYASLSSERGIMPILTELHKEEEPRRRTVSAAEIASPTKLRRNTMLPANQPENGVPELALRINNLSFAQKGVVQLLRLVRRNCENLGIGRFRWQNVFSRTRWVLRAAQDALCTHLVHHLVFHDMRSSFVEAVYLPVVRQCPLTQVLPELDQKEDLMGLLYPEVHEVVLGKYAIVIVDVFRRQLFEMGNWRVFCEDDYSFVETDIDALQELLAKYVPPDHDALQTLGAIRRVAQALMPLSTTVLVDAFEAALLGEARAKGSPDLRNPLCSTHLRRIICHRSDPHSKAFIKKFKIKASKLKV